MGIRPLATLGVVCLGPPPLEWQIIFAVLSADVEDDGNHGVHTPGAIASGVPYILPEWWRGFHGILRLPRQQALVAEGNPCHGEGFGVDDAARWKEEAILYGQPDDPVGGESFGDAGAVGLEGRGGQGGGEDTVGGGGGGGILGSGVLRTRLVHVPRLKDGSQGGDVVEGGSKTGLEIIERGIREERKTAALEFRDEVLVELPQGVGEYRGRRLRASAARRDVVCNLSQWNGEWADG